MEHRFKSAQAKRVNKESWSIVGIYVVGSYWRAEEENLLKVLGIRPGVPPCLEFIPAVKVVRNLVRLRPPTRSLVAPRTTRTM
jgi:hypothetical protein